MRRLKKKVGNRIARIRYYDKNAQNAATEEKVEVVTEETAEVEETEGSAETEAVETVETVEIGEPDTVEKAEEVEPEVVEEAEVVGTDEPEVIEEVGKITEPAETTEEEEEANAIEEVAEAVEPEEETETTAEVEDVEEVPLEYAEEETEAILEEEGSLDGNEDEVAALAEKAEEEENEVQEALKPEAEEPEVIEEVEVAGTNEPEVIEEVGRITEPAETTEDEEDINAIEEVAEAVEPENGNAETVEEVETVEEIAEEPTETEKSEELAATAAEELAEDETEEEVGETEETEETEEAAAEEKPAEKESFKLTAPSNLEEILSKICVKRGRKLIYRPNEILFNETATVIGTDKNNEEGIKIKNILDEEIKQGVKLGYIDKYDGLKMSEIKEEYENDTVYEYAEQEFKRTGLLLEGDKVKVYIYDWDMKALHHVGYIEGEEAESVKPYLMDREKYSFDICGLITGGKYRKVIKDESGKVTVEKGNDGKLGVELDISVIARKD